MKRFLLTLLSIALVAALAAFFAVPAAIRQIRLRENAQAASGYRAATDGLSPQDCDAMLAQAKDYNRALDSDPWTDPYAPGETDPAQADEADSYESLLNPTGDGVMAVLEAPKLGVTLAVYHGGEANVARLAHAQNSRLPAGGESGPCVLYATTERYFKPLSNLERLTPGDCFFLRVVQDTATYEVFQVATLSPQALSELKTRKADDECALVARTEAGDRLVVRGRRVPRQSVKPVDDSMALPGGVPELMLAAPVAAAGLALLAVIELFRRTIRRIRRRHMKL